MFNIVRYTPEHKQDWDHYVQKARNATFLFYRDYMDYHADRFKDHSLIIYKGQHIFALLPAHEQGDVFISHKGLTYGGLIIDSNVTAVAVMEVFRQLNLYLKEANFRQVIYRAIPWIYHQQPSEEDLYALFTVCNAQLSERKIATALFLQNQQPWRKDHRRRLNLAHSQNVEIRSNEPLERFWPLLEQRLSRKFSARPVHTLQEIQLLQSRFPENIILYGAYKDDAMVGGLLIYVTPQVIHGQYSATNEEGDNCGAMEAIYEKVFADYQHLLYFDNGTSIDPDTQRVSEGLIQHKEGYGGRAICYDTYTWTIDK